MPKYSARAIGHLSAVFQALADPTRRAVLERLSGGPAATLELARPFAMALPSFLQHLDVLERVGLVKSSKVGRVRRYELSAKPLTEAEGWLSGRRQVWEKRLDQFDRYILDMKKENA